MGYTHKGIIGPNGTVDDGLELKNTAELAIRPEDDGYHLADHGIGDFEWWYFDLYDEKSDCFLKVVIHIGTDPLKTRIYPQLAVSVNTPNRTESFSRPYHFSDLETDTGQCNITIREDVRIRTQYQHPSVYTIEINIPGFQCHLSYSSRLEGWKPLGDKVPFHVGRKSGTFSWTIPVPKARVEGDFACRGEKYILEDAIGYHDHNYVKVGKKHPLHLDELVTRWYWGRCHTERYTLIFMDTYGRTNRMLSLLVAQDDKIIHSSNNGIDCRISSTDVDTSLGTEYPSSIMIRSNDPDLPLEAAFNSVRLLESKDLLEGVNPLLKWLIKKLIARPAYHGVFAKVRLKIFDQTVTGFGNYESMVFRHK